jgi:hypothetical protein
MMTSLGQLHGDTNNNVTHLLRISPESSKVLEKEALNTVESAI